MKKILIVFYFAIILLQVAVSQNNSDLVSVFTKSYEFESAKNYTKAIETLNTVYSTDNYAINLRLGWLHYLNGEYIKSQMYYKKAITNSNNSIEARLGYIYPASKLENWDNVLQTYIEILKIDPNNTYANYWIAYTYYLRNDFKTALIHIKKNLSLYPFDFDSNLLACSIYVGLGDIVNAKKCISTALLINPSSEEAKELMKKL